MQEQPTAAEAGRDPSTEIAREELTSPFTPTQDWIRHYHKQATAKLISGLNQYARTRALSVADAGRKVDDYYARELVLDALGDTWLGVVRWDPDKCSLGYHVVRTIEGRADKHRYALGLISSHASRPSRGHRCPQRGHKCSGLPGLADSFGANPITRINRGCEGVARRGGVRDAPGRSVVNARVSPFILVLFERP